MSDPIITKTTVTSYKIYNWQEIKSKLKSKFPNLTEPDLDYDDNKVEEFFENLSSKIGKAIGKTNESIHKFIESL